MSKDFINKIKIESAERHRLAMSVAMLWILTIGGEQEMNDGEQLIENFSKPSLASTFSSPSLSCFVNGLLTLVAQLLNGQSISFGRLFPLPLSHFSDLAFSDSF